MRSGVLWYHAPGDNEAIVANHYVASPPVVRRVPAADVQFLALCDGTRDLDAIATATHLTVDRVAKTIEHWQAIAPRMFASPEQAAAGARADAARQAALELWRGWQSASAPANDNNTYHRRDIRNAFDQFDQVETTVSHAFREPSRALGGRRYGEAFCDALLDRGAFSRETRVLEIGGGVGYFADAVLDRLKERAPDIYDTARWTMLDLSPTLLASQQSICQIHASRMEFLHGDAETIDLPPASFDLVVANEMIADLSIGTAATSSDAQGLTEQYHLDRTPELPASAVNVGAIRLVERLASWLAPGATAVLTEYGSLTGFPTVVELGGHNEHSIHFGHLARVADALSLAPAVQNLGDFLQCDGDYQVVRGGAIQMLRAHLLPYLGAVNLPAGTYDEETLRRQLGDLGPSIGNVQSGPLRTEGLITPFEFFALTLRVSGPRRSVRDS